ncbi:hypothetical protein [Pararhodobacter sp. CCB-MM2]|uniref:hypothetical protein n=1 Tax=Pararhodobacter sp. CCB-MM2 TaxID=1786003 RepID=UPI000831DB44|nr:hypothetical protein [Pararhodobacter sp. CCB-MM2]
MQNVTKNQIHAAMRALVKRIGQEAAAQHICDWHGDDDSRLSFHRSDLSMKMNDKRAWTAFDIIALEDALGRYSVTAIFQGRVATDEGPAPDLMQGLASAMKESGEATAAALTAIASGNASDMAKAAVEWREAVEAFQSFMPAFDVVPDAAAIPMRGGVR